MRPEDREDLLFTLSELAEAREEGGATLPDTTLQAYREGNLRAREAAEVEEQLASNPSLRRRLAALAGESPEVPDADRKRRVLGAVAAERSAPTVSPVAGSRRSWWRPLAAAAVLVVALGVGWWVSRTPVVTPPAYSVHLAALTVQRDAGESGPETPATEAEAFPDTRVTLEVTVVEQAIDGVAIGVYRSRDGQLERVPDDLLGRTEQPGVAVITAAASTLVGSQPGSHDLFVVVAWQGDLPASVAVGRDPLAELEAGGRRRAYRLTLRLLAERSAALFIERRTSDEEVADVSHPGTARLVADLSSDSHFCCHQRPRRQHFLGPVLSAM